MRNYNRAFVDVVWWKNFNSVDAKKWMNVIAVVEVLFSLPVSNGQLHGACVFTAKSNKRTSLGELR